MSGEERVEAVALVRANLLCDCYHQESMEYDPAGPCDRCRLLELLGEGIPA